MLSKLPMLDVLPNDEGRIVEFLNKHTTKSPGELVGMLYGSVLGDVLRYIETTPFQTMEDIPEMFHVLGFTNEAAADNAADLVDWVYDILQERYEGKLNQKMDRFSNRGANRALYVFEPVFSWYEVHTKEGEPTGLWRWKYDRHLRSFGLLAQIVNHLHGLQNEPVAMGILVETPDEESEEQPTVDSKTALRAMVKEHIAISGRRLGWNQKSPGWKILVKTFPQVIDTSAYCHGLNAPVMPQGFLAEVPVNFAKLTTPEGLDLGTDGSGIYHADYAPLAPFIAKYGLVAFQLRVLEPNSGLFAKGIVFPSELALDSEGKPALKLDWRQIKARWKKAAKENRVADASKQVDKCFVGILQAWHRPGKLSGSFELLENIRTTKRTKEIISQLVDRAMNDLSDGGIDGLASDVARKDPIIRLMLQLLHAASTSGLKLHPWHVPRIREAIKDRLARRLYTATQGAGIKVPSYVARIDATIPHGKVVLSKRDGSWIPAGTKIAGFRFPIILPQGLLQLTTIEPPAHLLVREVISQTSYEEVWNDELQEWERVTT